MRNLILVFLLFCTPVYSVDFNVSWLTTKEREDGRPIDLSEIGGYEIKFKCEPEEERFILLEDNSLTSHSFSYATKSESCNFSIRVYDINGIYSKSSNVVLVVIPENLSPIVAPTITKVSLSTSIDLETLRDCTVETNCTLIITDE